MNFGITNGNNCAFLYKEIDGLDYSAINKTSTEIFSKTQANKPLDNINLNRFTRLDNGINLYDGTVKTDTAINISLQNSGHNINLNNDTVANIQYLNTHAANDLIVKNLDGKVNIENTNAMMNLQTAYTPTVKIPNSSRTNAISNEGGNPFGAGTGGMKQ